ncbi:MAG TPA: EipA family protein [Caulobacteraceae bacterium]|jgi:hypothetical protein|nr:EipA family protein [Caulobacteraceae bacterium]
MQSLSHIRSFAAATALAGVLALPAMAQPGPDAHIRFSGGSVAFIAGVNWGKGTLTYHGRNTALKVNGLSVGAVGATKFSAEGEVYNLHKVSDIEGTYTAIEASATAGAGEGVIDMKNAAGVEIRAHATSSGLKLALAPTGVEIKLK